MPRPVTVVRKAAGAEPVRSVDELLRRAPLMLVATGEPFEYPHPDWSDSVELIGPCDFDPPATAPQWLTDIDRPIVVVTTSSDPQADSQLPIAAMAAMADAPVHVVATYPSGVPDEIAAPRNATVLKFTPHGMVLDRAVCAITHGGMGATQKRSHVAFRSASCRMAATSSRLPGVLRLHAPEPGYPPRSSLL
jgi:UDP:flavonoid glycosyltransferase YjiC (YdhE family)